MNQDQIAADLARLLKERKVVTVTSKRGTPVWLGDSIGTIVSLEGNTLTLRDRDRTMGGHAQTKVSLDRIVAVREARPSDVTGSHNDR